MSVVLGVRVVRGPDWEWGDQDGGEGFVGTVAGLEEGGDQVVVQWDMGQRYRLRCGYAAAGKHDLRILDSGPAGVHHAGFSCGWCSSPSIAGTLWKCVRCFRYYLCSRCYHADKHSLEHEFERVDGMDLNQRTRLGSRVLARRVMSRGIFRDAVVVRGADWRWEDQDGGPGCHGRVASIEGWGQETYMSVAQVMWGHSNFLNIYRVGHKGMVDLQCVSPSNGAYYYPDHLPTLGEEYDPAVVRGLSAGDGVRVELDPGLFKIAQEEHGGWSDVMAEYIGRDGTVHSIRDDGDVIVRYSNNKIFQMNRLCVTQVECSGIDYGDVVRVIDDIATVHKLQCGHGEWTDDMALALGQVGRVVKIRPSGDVRVAVNGSRWVFNPKSLTLAPGEIPIEERTGQLHVDLTVRIQTLSLSEAGCSDVVVTAAAGGDLHTLTKYLQQHPSHVNEMYEGKAAIHVAAMEGYLPIVRLLIKYTADLDIKDENDLTALHLCSYVNNGAVAKLLVEGGADVNASDDRGAPPLSVAAACGYMDVVKVLLEQPEIDLDLQDHEGRSPLHSAVLSHQLRSLVALLEAGADPSVLNHRLFSPIHNATVGAFLPGVEEILKWNPKLINIPRKDGFTPIHLAAIGGHTDVVALLASHLSCDVDAKDNDDLIPLHIAAHEGYTVMVERLVGYGADLNYATPEGNTALHLALGRGCMAAPSALSPQILEVKRELDQLCGPDTLRPNVIVGVFLVREGASLRARNKQGFTPLDARPTDVAQLLTSYASSHTKPMFHGKLRQMDSPFDDLSPKIPRTPQRVPRKPRPPPASKPSKPPEAVPAKKAINHAVNVNTYAPSPMYDKDINPYAKSATASALDAVAGTCTLEPCSLCEDGPVCIMFQPCGHVMLCDLCGTRAKRCMQKECRAEVKAVIQLCAVCCKNQPASVHPACSKSHRLCSRCIARSSKCLLCSAVLMKVTE